MTKQPNFGPISSQKSENFTSYMCSCDTEGIYKQYNEISISPILLNNKASSHFEGFRTLPNLLTDGSVGIHVPLSLIVRTTI